MDLFEKFNKLHQSPTPLLVGNIWDVNSAKVFEKAGYQAIATSSQALAIANGYDDGEQLPFDILLRAAKRVVEVVSIPFSVDIEGGYDRTVVGITQHIQQLYDVGVVGINIEDTIAGSDRSLQIADHFGKQLEAIAEFIIRKNLKIFLNVRTDGFLLGIPTALEETLKRIEVYEKAGANGIFVPCITDKNDIKAVVGATKLPINVMCMADLPDFEELESLGVKRISMGGFPFFNIYDQASKLAQAIRAEGNFKPVFAKF